MNEKPTSKMMRFNWARMLRVLHKRPTVELRAGLWEAEMVHNAWTTQKGVTFVAWTRGLSDCPCTYEHMQMRYNGTHRYVTAVSRPQLDAGLKESSDAWGWRPAAWGTSGVVRLMRRP